VSDHWLNERASEDHLYFTHGPVLWNELKEALKFTIDEFHRHYVSAGTVEIAFEACAGGDPSCVRLRKSPKEYIDIRFDLPNLRVVCSNNTGYSVTLNLGITDRRTVQFCAEGSVQAIWTCPHS
jgi:hypothetical protein